MNGNGAGGDKIERAIQAVVQPEEVAMRQFEVTIASTGRPAIVVLPADATDAEIAEFSGWLLTAVLNTYRVDRAQPKRSGLVVARTIPT